MARAPSAPGKTRLAPHLPEPRLRKLRQALLADTLATVAAVPHVDVVVFVTPPGLDEEVRRIAPPPMTIAPQRGDALGDRMRHALHDLIDDRGYEAAMLVGTDAPLAGVDHLTEALRLLRTRGGVVLGPSDDGGYFLIGMTRVHDALFDGIEWGSDTVLLDTMAAAERLGAQTCLIRGTYDIDTVDDLRRLERDLATEPPQTAPALRRFFSEGS